MYRWSTPSSSGKGKRNTSYSQFSDHYFTGDYPVSPLDADGENKTAQLSLLSGKSSQFSTYAVKVGFFNQYISFCLSPQNHLRV